MVAEQAAVWYACERLSCVVYRRAVRSQWQSVDMFACDIVGKQVTGRHVYLQVTAGKSQAVTKRRRKIEAIPWHESDIVQILQFRQKVNAHDRRKRVSSFRVHDFRLSDGGREWAPGEVLVAIPERWTSRAEV